jgi:signal transduction histidine kinase
MIARAESGHARGNMIDFDAAEAARDVGELYEPLAEEQGLALDVEAPAAVLLHGNRELIGQALANLIDNAIKYAAPAAKAQTQTMANGEPSTVTVTAATEGDKVLLSVADRGPGIPEADRARAVERFVRLEKSRSVPGSGLGLSLAAAVARLHGGELRLEDNAPGLRAVLVLPRAAPQTQPAAAPAETEHPAMPQPGTAPA